MTKLVWDQSGDRLFETGVSNGVLYVRNSAGGYPLGVPWNGLTAVTESPSGAEATPLYADNIKYLSLMYIPTKNQITSRKLRAFKPIFKLKSKICS